MKSVFLLYGLDDLWSEDTKWVLIGAFRTKASANKCAREMNHEYSTYKIEEFIVRD